MYSNIKWAAGFKLAVLTVDGTIEVQLPCNLDDDMNIVIENKGVPYPEGRGIHHVSLSYTWQLSPMIDCHGQFGAFG